MVQSNSDNPSHFTQSECHVIGQDSKLVSISIVHDGNWQVLHRSHDPSCIQDSHRASQLPLQSGKSFAPKHSGSSTSPLLAYTHGAVLLHSDVVSPTYVDRLASVLSKYTRE